ncbi:MAG: TolC family protein [Planctomycetes bacterium]|nr:TolC family protein [Planctomycetota bacterium]
MFRSSSLLALLALLSACQSADSWRDDADKEVYAILEQRRAELGVTDAFTLAQAEKPLRAQLLERVAEGQTEPLHLDLVAALQVASENSRDWQDQREALFLSALDLTRERWNFSVQENGTLSAFLAGPAGTAETDGGFLSNLNLFKLLGIGTSITLDAGVDLLEDIGHADLWDAVSHLSLNITQPILRGFGRDIVMEPLTQAERDVVYQARAYERFRRTFAVDVAQSFFSTLERVDRLKNEQSNYDNLVRLRERNEALAEAGRLTDIQVDQARQDELSAEDRLVTARRDLDGALDDFKFTLGLPIETVLVLDENGLRSLEAWPALEVALDEARVIQTGLEKRLDHATTRDRVADAERGAHVAADALRMGLDLKAGAAVASPDGGGASLRAEDIDWRVGLDLDLPLDRIPERNAYRSALIALEASKRAADESGDRVTSQLRDSLRSLDAAQASFRIQSGSVILAERRVESAALNLDAGRASTRDVLEAQDSLLSAQNSLAAALTDTILAGLFLYRDMELLEVTPQGLAIDATPVGAQP